MLRKIQIICLPIYFLFFEALIFVSINSTTCLGQEIPGTVKQDEQIGVVAQNGYSYPSEGRSDPFKPFISAKATIANIPDPNEIIEEETVLTGMQLFEPGQLALVGILMSNDEQIALVEDQTKKGYVLKQGALIGRRGVVTEINKYQVIITETARTRAGKEITNTVTMKLNQEVDK